ncbi:MAG TPA: sensor domain-containing diguanylate cyclase, partial [Nitrospiria bacterium]|nr:sensor domain-containing diguanylate cyclase [Nitrospiria bacterium]
MARQKNIVKLVIVGGGKGGRALLDLLHDDPTVRILGMADTRLSAPGMVLAKRLRISTSKNFKKLLKQTEPDLVINVTGDQSVKKEISEGFPKVEIVEGYSARFLWELVEARISSREEIERLLIEYQSLYDLGLKLTASENLEKLYETIVDYSINLTNSPAGSLTIFEEKLGEMYLASSKGFSKRFSRTNRWRVRQGGLTSFILNHEEPFSVNNLRDYPRFNNPVMLREGIKSLMASPLKSEGKIMGILYVDDFKTREFSQRELSLLSLLSTYAAMAIEKTRLLESSRLEAITDELTGLYNHRHFRKQLNLEINRAERYRRSASLMMIDIDYFKQYNDANGHIKGNEVLKNLGRILKDVSREVDIVARYGGEEFAIIMPETERKEAQILSERVRK